MPEEIKKRRNNDLLAIQNKVSLADHVARIGQVVEVLVEGPSKTFLKSGNAQAANSAELPQLTGRTSTDHIVVFEGNNRLIGQMVPVAVHEATAFTLFGSVVTTEQIHPAQNDNDQERRFIPPLPVEPDARISLPVI